MTTQGINHLGLSVRELDQTAAFFVEALGWQETARDPAYPRCAITDGVSRLTLWQVADPDQTPPFDRRAQTGLHHLALTVDSEQQLNRLAEVIAAWPGVVVEFGPEPMGAGPRKHMMFAEPGGLRIELTWPGA